MEDYMEVDVEQLPPINLDYIQRLPERNRLELRDRYITALDPRLVEIFMGREVVNAAYSTRPISELYLSCDGNIGTLTWDTSPPGIEEEMLKWSTHPHVVLGFIRNQFKHRLCWGFTSTDMFSAGCILHGWEDHYCAFSPLHLCRFADPTLLGSEKRTDHSCYAYAHLYAMQYINSLGVTKVEVGQELTDFDCRRAPPLDPFGEAAQMSQRVKGVRRIATLEEALKELKLHHPVACNLIYYPEMLKRDDVYTGPLWENTGMNQYKAICLETAETKTESSKITRASNTQKHIDLDDVWNDGSLKPLQEVLEVTTDQKGFRVFPEKRQFDFSHGKPVDHGDLRMIESTVKEGEVDDIPQEAMILPEAKGIKVLSGEVYCDHVLEKEVGDASQAEEKALDKESGFPKKQ